MEQDGHQGRQLVVLDNTIPYLIVLFDHHHVALKCVKNELHGVVAFSLNTVFQ